MQDPEKNFEEMVRFAQTLVRINSVHGNETEVACCIREKLQEAGIRSRLVGKEKKRKSLIAVIGTKKNKSLLLNGHLDTVPFGDQRKWKQSPLSAKIMNGKLFGRGSYDMKGGLAALTYGFLALQDSDELNGRLMLALSSNEEGGQHSGIREILRAVHPSACLVGDSLYKDQLVSGVRGIYRFRLVTQGKTAHTGSTRKHGIHAVLKMSKALLQLQKTRFRFYARKPFFLPPSITPGTVISGGIAVNVVPDRCEALVDCRLGLKQNRWNVRADIQKALSSLQDKELKYRIEELAFSPAYLMNRKEKIAQIAEEQYRPVFRHKPSWRLAGGTSDSNIIFAHGIPVVVVGTKGKNAHSENEFVYTQSMLRLSKLCIGIAKQFLE